MNKVFSLFLMVALILGGSLGGAFAGGVALGKTQGADSIEARGAGSFSQGQGSRSGQFSGNRSQGREQGAGVNGPGQRSSQGAAPGEGGQQRFRQDGPESGGPRPDGDGRQGLDGRDGPREGGDRRGRGGVGGTIDTIDGNTLTITTPRGPTMVTMDPETAVRKVVDGSTEDLKQGVQIRVAGSREEEGTVKATSITLIPEGVQDIFGRRGPRQER